MTNFMPIVESITDRPDLDAKILCFNDGTEVVVPYNLIMEFKMPRLSDIQQNISQDYKHNQLRAMPKAEYEVIHPEVAALAEELSIKAHRLLRKNNGEMICLRLETGTHTAFPFIVTSLADAPSSKLGYRTREDAEAAATDYVREHSRPFYVMQIVSKLEKQPAPVNVADWTK